MAWNKTSYGPILVLEETYTLPSSATTEYTTEISYKDMAPNEESARNITVSFNASAVTGTNLDIALYGAMTSGGTKFLLLDAVVADITATGTVAAVVNLNSYPAPYYYFAWTSDVDEDANTIDVKVTIPPQGI